MTRLTGMFIRLAISVIGSMMFGNVAMAQSCSVSIDQMNFGKLTQSSLSSSGTVATVRADCTGQANETIRLCPSFQSGGIANISASGYQLHVSLYSDVNHQVPWHSGIDIVLNGAGAGHATIPIYGRIAQGSRVIKSGQYAGVIDLALVGTYLSTGSICGGGAHALRPPVTKPATSIKAVSAKR